MTDDRGRNKATEPTTRSTSVACLSPRTQRTSNRPPSVLSPQSSVLSPQSSVLCPLSSDSHRHQHVDSAAGVAILDQRWGAWVGELQQGALAFELGRDVEEVA